MHLTSSPSSRGACVVIHRRFSASGTAVWPQSGQMTLICHTAARENGYASAVVLWEHAERVDIMRRPIRKERALRLPKVPGLNR